MPVLTGLTRETCRVLLLKKIIKQVINKLIRRKTPCAILQRDSQKTEFRGKTSLCSWEQFTAKWDFPCLLSFEWHLKNTAAKCHAHKVWSQAGSPPSQALAAFSVVFAAHGAQSQAFNSNAPKPPQASILSHLGLLRWSVNWRWEASFCPKLTQEATATHTWCVRCPSPPLPALHPSPERRARRPPTCLGDITTPF